MTPNFLKKILGTFTSPRPGNSERQGDHPVTGLASADSSPAAMPAGNRAAFASAPSAVNWNRTVFLHTRWTSHYDGSEAPEGGHGYLKRSVGVEAENFKPVDGWCYGYAPVSRTSKGRQSAHIPEGDRVLKIDKLGAAWHEKRSAG